MEFFTKILETIISLWKRGKALLWALAGICAVIFGVFMATALLGVSDADAKALRASLRKVLAGHGEQEAPTCPSVYFQAVPTAG